jgi:hypothetical protein
LKFHVEPFNVKRKTSNVETHHSFTHYDSS